MKITRYRHHKANTGQGTYESHDFGASVEFDSATQELPEKYTRKKGGGIAQYLEDQLDALLDPAAQRAVESGVIHDSHIREYYEI